MAFRFDRHELKPAQRRDDGSVRYDGVLTRSGVFSYRVQKADGSFGVRREWRPPAEVGKADSLATLELAHVCNDHPARRGDAKKCAVGTVGTNIAWDGKSASGSFVVRDDTTNDAVASGKRQLSPGYDVDLDETPGTTPEGERYDAVQRNIRYEHVAIVHAGRQGSEVSLRFDAADAGVMVEERDDAAVRLGYVHPAICTVSSTSLSAVDLEKAVAAAVVSIPGAAIERSDGARGDAAAPTAVVTTDRWGTPSLSVSTRDLSLDDLTSHLAAALGPRVSVKRGDAATTTHQDTAAMDLAAQLAAALKDAADQKTRADGLQRELDAAKAEAATQKARADKAEGERDAAKDRADKADKARQDAIDAGPALARARVKLEDHVKGIVGADFKVDGLSDHDLRLAALDKHGAKISDEDRKSEVYVKARFDSAVEVSAAANLHVDAARGAGGGAQGGQRPMTEAEAMAEARRRSVARAQHGATGTSA